MTIPGYPVRMSRSPVRVVAPPQPGEHTEAVIRDWLGEDARALGFWGTGLARRTGPAQGDALIRREAAIVGIGQTRYGKALPGTAWDLAMEAVLAACADAGLDVTEVDGMCRFTAPFEPVSEAMLVRGLGIPELSFFAQAPHGGEALGAVVMQAAAAVSAGLASVVVVYRALSQSTGGRFGRADGRGPGGARAGPQRVPSRR